MVKKRDPRHAAPCDTPGQRALAMCVPALLYGVVQPVTGTHRACHQLVPQAASLHRVPAGFQLLCQAPTCCQFGAQRSRLQPLGRDGPTAYMRWQILEWFPSLGCAAVPALAQTPARPCSHKPGDCQGIVAVLHLAASGLLCKEQLWHAALCGSRRVWAVRQSETEAFVAGP